MGNIFKVKILINEDLFNMRKAILALSNSIINYAEKMKYPPKKLIEKKIIKCAEKLAVCNGEYYNKVKIIAKLLKTDKFKPKHFYLAAIRKPFYRDTYSAVKNHTYFINTVHYYEIIRLILEMINRIDSKILINLFNELNEVGWPDVKISKKLHLLIPEQINWIRNTANSYECGLPVYISKYHIKGICKLNRQF